MSTTPRVGAQTPGAIGHFSFLVITDISGKCCIQALGDTLSISNDPKPGKITASLLDSYTHNPMGSPLTAP
jgi:hypothetical protein